MTSLWQDLRFGLRMLGRQPGFTVVSLLVLSLGIGVNTAAFSLVNALVLKPRVGNVDAQLTGVYNRHKTQPNSYREFSYEEFRALRDRDDLFEMVTGHSFGLAGLKEGDSTRRVFVDIVTAGYLETFGVSPTLGRPFTVEEERPGATLPVAMLSHSLWRKMGGAPDVLGTQIELNSRLYTVVGVVPEGFGGSMVMVTPEVWVPTGMYDQLAFDLRNVGSGATLSDPEFRALILVAKLPEGESIETMTPAMDTVSGAMALANPAAYGDHQLELAPLSRLSVGTRPQVDDELTGLTAVLLSLSGVVLVIASFNLANMLLARGRARSREFAIRLAIGGSRWRIVRQLLTEGLLLSLIGGVGGLLASWAATRLLFVAMPAMLPISLAFDPTPDARVLAATASFCLLATVIFGLGPAWTIARANALPDIKAQMGDVAVGRRRRFGWLTARDTLVMGQLALTFVMVTVAGLFVRGSMEASRSDPGFTLDRGIIANLDTALADLDTEQGRRLVQQSLSELCTYPGVVSASLASHMPFGEFQESRNVQRPGPPVLSSDPNAAGARASATMVSIASNYFDAAGIPLEAGRDFTVAEAFAETGEPLAIIDRSLARHLFGSEDPLGQSIQHSGPTEDDPPVLLRVVGVVGGIRESVLEDAPTPFVYRPFGQRFRGNVYLHARTDAVDASAEALLLPGLQQRLRAAVPNLPLLSLETRPIFRQRNLILAVMKTGAGLFAVFGAAALFLAAVGVYGVKAYLVSRRTREIGVRIALGAQPRDVVLMVVREGLLLVGVGLIAGAGLSLIAGQLVRGMLFQGRAMDLPVILVASGTLLTALLLASWLPARRATAIQPVRALRME